MSADLEPAEGLCSQENVTLLAVTGRGREDSRMNGIPGGPRPQ